MSGRIAARLKELEIVLPAAPSPVANYAAFVCTGPYLYVSGQLPANSSAAVLITGTIGRDLSASEGKSAARLAAINVLAVASVALGGELDRIRRVVKLTGFVHAAPDFTGHPEVIDGASELFVEIFGEAGGHARAAVGAASLPRGAAVEIDALFEVA